MQTDLIILPDIDLTEFQIEGEINTYFAEKGLPKRIKCRRLGSSALLFEFWHYKLALYVHDTNELYRLDGCFALHWRLIAKAVRDKFDNVKIH